MRRLFAGLALVVAVSSSAFAVVGLAGAQTAVVSPRAEMVDRFYRGRAVVDAAVRAVGGAQALRGLTAIEYEVYGEVSNDVQGYSAARIGNPAHDGGIRIINRFDISGARFYQRVEQSYDSGYDSAFATVWRGGVQYSPRWVSRDYTETEGAPSPFSAGGPFMVASRWMPPLILQRALQNFRAAAWVGESSTADGPADVVEVSFDEATRFRIHVARSNAMVRRVEAVAPDPLAADDVSVAELSGEQTVSGIVFPVQSRALRRGAPTQVLRLRGVVVNPALSELDFAPPEGFSRLENTTQVRATQIAGRVYEVSGLAGGTYQAPFVVMDDFVVAYEAPLGVAQTRQVIAEIRRIAGDKPIRYVVISHFHADHAGGVYVEAGATILSSAENEAVLRAYAAFNRPQFQGQEGPRTDLEMRFQAVPEAGYEIVDGAGSRLRILDLANNTHVEHMLGLFDPDTGVFMGADHYIEAVLWNPTFERTARWVRENPQVTTILGTHVRPVTRAEFLRIAAERRDEPRRGRLHWEGLRRR